MKKYMRKYIGKTYTTNESYEVEVINGGSKKGFCTIRFNKPVEYVTEVSVYALKKGNIKNLYNPSICNIGYFGLGSHKAFINGKITKSYSCWNNMIKRCYDESIRKKNPTYKDIPIVSEWLNFQNFANWFDENYIEGYDLDKDLLSTDEKIYSPKTCIFIPPRINKFMTNVQSNNTSYTGVGFHKCSNKYRARTNCFDTGSQINIGVFDNPEEASISYNKERAKQTLKAQQYMRDLGYEEYIIERIK